MRRLPASPWKSHAPGTHVSVAWAIAALLLAGMAAQLVRGVLADSATSDEPIHVLSGYTALTQRHALFDPEHPFPFKALGALPLLLLRPTLPTAVTHLAPLQAATHSDTYALANAASFTMLFGSGDDRWLLRLPRLVTVVVTLLFALAMFLWTRALFGPASGLLALALVAFDPSFLAHGHLANDDTAAALAFIVALAAFDRFLRRPSRRSLALAGLGFGAAAVTKYSLLLLGPTYIVLLALWLRHDRRNPASPPIFRRLPRRWMRLGAGLLATLTIGWLTIWLCYGALFLLNPAQNPLFSAPFGNRALNAAARLFPAQYVNGIAGVAHPRVGYLLGSCFTGSRFDYFPLLALFKIPLPTLILIGSGLCLLALDRRRIGFTGVVLLLPTALFLLVAGFARIDIGFRHALPFYAPLLVLAAAPASRLARPRMSSGRRSLAPALALIGLLIWLSVDSVRAAPHYLPYFNGLAGEPRPAPYVASDSNVDWGQATGALADYVRAYRIPEVAFANFNGYAEAAAIGLPYVPADPGNRDYTGYLAISRTAMVDDRCAGGAKWGWVVDTRLPIAVIAGAINLYYLP